MTGIRSETPAGYRGRTRRLWLAWGLVVVCASRVGAQSSTPEAPVSPTPTLALSDVLERSEAARVRLQAIEQKVPAQDTLLQMQTELSQLAARVDTLAEETDRRLGGNPPLSVLGDIEFPWLQVRPELAQRKDQLTKLAKQLDGLSGEITQLAGDAAEAGTALAAAHAPPEVIERDSTLRQAIDEVRKDLQARQRKLLLLRDRTNESLARADDAMADIDAFSRSRVQQITVPETVPLWRQRTLWDTTAAGAQVRQTAQDFAQPLLPYLRRTSWRIGTQLLLFVLAALLLRHGRRTALTWPQRDALLEQFVAITEHPWSAALLASLTTMLRIDSDAPRIVWVIAGWLAIPAAVRVVLRLMEPQQHFLAYVLTIYAGASLLRGAFSASAPLLQAFVTVETLVACGLTAWVVHRRVDRFGPRVEHLLRRFGPFAVLLLAANCVAALYGYLDLAQLVMSATLGSAWVGVILLVSTRIVLGLFAYLLRVSPFTHLRLVRRNRERILSWLSRTFTVLVGLLWALLVLRNLRLLEGFLSALQALLEVRLQRGAISVSMGDLVGFGITLWGSWLLSSFVRFVLEEDIYPRLTLPRGVPFALSTLLRYCVLVFGFFVALGVVGVDLTKATILAGALGVGIGFGLQNVVNNFVSGLILLFERPVQVGDTVAIREVAGEIQHIGIRSCVVRTWDGAEVILPNAVLISDPVTNWTLSNRLRRITLSVGVAYGSDPARVVELLRGVAAAQDGVMPSPEPLALFTGFGDSALNFELRVWTDRYDSWGGVRSNLYLGIYKALSDAGIAIPFPQRDVRLDSRTPVPVRVVDDGGESGQS
jgi:potassium efflux system protein